MTRYCSRVFGPLYFSGTDRASTHILDTGDGLIIFDSGMPADVPDLLADMKALGLDPADIRRIFMTHGHIDHMGGTKQLVALTGAKTYLGEPDFDAATGARPLTFAEELGYTWDQAFTPDVAIRPDDRFRFGQTEIVCRATPGHTAGAMSFFFDVTDPETGRTFRAGLHGGAGVNSLTREYLTKQGLPFSLRDDFRASMTRLASEPVDIFLGNHMAHNRTVEKISRLRDGETLAFVDPTEWRRWSESILPLLDDLLAREAGKNH